MNSKPYPWRLFWLLLAAQVFAVLSIVPIALDIVRLVSSRVPAPTIPIPLLILIGAVENFLLLAFTLWLGLKLSRRLGLGAPLLEAWVTKKPVSKTEVRAALKSGALSGLLVGAGLLLALVWLSSRLPNLPPVVVANLPLWKRVLLCFYGGIYEELLTRLFLLTLLAWLFDRGWRKREPGLSNPAFWLANFLAALLFGLGHLPTASLFLPITTLVIVAAILFNGVAGVTFGYLYRRRGLEAAMLAHFIADFVIYVVGSSFLKR
jgi:membrane protease YdiL (CAAX protease family)